jgi:hypothetical protein
MPLLGLLQLLTISLDRSQSGMPATTFLPSLVLTAFLSNANAIYTTVAIARSQTLTEPTPFGLVLVIHAKIAMPASSCADHAAREFSFVHLQASAQLSQVLVHLRTRDHREAKGRGGSSDRAKVNGTFPSAAFDTVHALAKIVDWQSSERHALPDVVPYPGAVPNSAERHGCPPALSGLSFVGHNVLYDL